MTVKTFFIGLAASFALPWLVVVAVPYASMRNVEIPQFDEVDDGKTGYYAPVKAGRTQNGSEIYGAEGCAQCHSQLSRPTYAGNDLGRPDLAGIQKDPNLGDTRRESNLWDYAGEEFAWIGETRIGPDLGNYGRRIEIQAAEENAKIAAELGVKVEELTVDQKFNKEKAVFAQLYNARLAKPNSVCPSNKHMFDEQPVFGQGYENALEGPNGEQVVAKPKALALTSYLLNMKRDSEVPYAMNHARSKKKASAK
ncbi:hypothetical protein ACFPK9_11490 [Rubritalea spongiae]|uniref:Cytochrome c domain-containing protein n=1 Tax=Rubritalea spongiae TaxID=430797 RepID=A0ABW5DY80_9BACT